MAVGGWGETRQRILSRPSRPGRAYILDGVDVDAVGETDGGGRTHSRIHAGRIAACGNGKECSVSALCEQRSACRRRGVARRDAEGATRTRGEDGDVLHVLAGRDGGPRVGNAIVAVQQVLRQGEGGDLCVNGLCRLCVQAVLCLCMNVCVCVCVCVYVCAAG